MPSIRLPAPTIAHTTTTPPPPHAQAVELPTMDANIPGSDAVPYPQHTLERGDVMVGNFPMASLPRHTNSSQGARLKGPPTASPHPYGTYNCTAAVSGPKHQLLGTRAYSFSSHMAVALLRCKPLIDSRLNRSILGASSKLQQIVAACVRPGTHPSVILGY